MFFSNSIIYLYNNVQALHFINSFDIKTTNSYFKFMSNSYIIITTHILSVTRDD